MAEFGVSAGYFIVELDGVAAMEASEVNGVKAAMEPFELNVGTRDAPIYGRGKRKMEPVTVKLGGMGSTRFIRCVLIAAPNQEPLAKMRDSDDQPRATGPLRSAPTGDLFSA